MRSSNWFLVFTLAAVVGISGGYFLTLLIRPSLLPPSLRWGTLNQPTTILFLGVDVVYSQDKRKARADLQAFSGRSDTVMVVRLDPIRDTMTSLHIPRDTEVHIKGYGMQKINSANALGGPLLAKQVVSEFLGLPIDHYVVLNVQGLVKMVNDLGGVTVDIPKRMKYMDWTAKLKIDLEPGLHTLTGNQSMGFVRFRHDALGDIGRVQRQQIFLRAVLDKAVQPESWSHIPELIAIGHDYVSTDLDQAELLSIANFIRAVPKKNQQLVMLPGNFSANGSGNWTTNPGDVAAMASRLVGTATALRTRNDIRVAIENNSGDPELGRLLSAVLRDKGYFVVSIKSAGLNDPRCAATRIYAQKANPEDAEMIKTDLNQHGEVLTASVGDLQSEVTIMAGDDLEDFVKQSLPLKTAR